MAIKCLTVARATSAKSCVCPETQEVGATKATAASSYLSVAIHICDG